MTFDIEQSGKILLFCSGPKGAENSGKGESYHTKVPHNDIMALQQKNNLTDKEVNLRRQHRDDRYEPEKTFNMNSPKEQRQAKWLQVPVVCKPVQSARHDGSSKFTGALVCCGVLGSGMHTE